MDLLHKWICLPTHGSRICAMARTAACGKRPLYNYGLYEGPKQDGIRNNILLDPSGFVTSGADNDAGRALIRQYLDEFFAQFPLD